MFRRSLAVLTLVLLPAASASATPFQNGSFEVSPLNPGAGFITLPGGNTQITGWTVFGANIDYIGSYWQAADGGRSLDLIGNGGIGRVDQTFDTVAGTSYMVQFAMAGNPDGDPTTNSIIMAAIGSPAAVYVFNEPAGTTRANMNWQYYQYFFTATSNSTTLAFQSNHASDFYGPALDNVSVSTVPEPATMTLLGLGLAGAAIRRRKAAASN